MADALFETPSVGCAPVHPADGAPLSPHALGGESATPSPVALRGEAQPAGPVHHKVIGVDLSLTATGVADRHGSTTIPSEGHRDDTLLQRRERLACIRRGVLDWTVDADLVCIEGPSYGSKGGSAHDRAGLWWLLVSALMHRGVRVVEVAPSSLKVYATGKGNRLDKHAVLLAAERRLPIPIDNDNEADAAWLCAMGHDLLGEALIDLPAQHRRALVTVHARFGDLV